MGLRQEILYILTNYDSARVNTETSVRIRTTFQSIAEEVREIALLQGNRNVRSSSDFSVGYQSAVVPWIAVSETKENAGQYREVFVMLLFKADMSGIYLTINQGGGIAYSNPISTLDFLEDMEAGSIDLSKEFLHLLNSGFFSDRNIDLGNSGIIGRVHEKATVVYKYYDRNQLPLEDEIKKDISTILGEYEDFIGKFHAKNLLLWESKAFRNETINKLLQEADVDEEDVASVEREIATAIGQITIGELNNLIVKIDDRNKIQKVRKQDQKSGRYKRNPFLSWGLKQKYEDRCQVCQEKLVVEKGFFCDTHHIVPLKEGGSDTSDNIAVVCPNHHRLLDRCNWQIISRTESSIVVKNKDQTVLIKLLKEPS